MCLPSSSSMARSLASECLSLFSTGSLRPRQAAAGALLPCRAWGLPCASRFSQSPCFVGRSLWLREQRRFVARVKVHRFAGVVPLKVRAPKSEWYLEAEKEFLSEREQASLCGNTPSGASSAGGGNPENGAAAPLLLPSCVFRFQPLDSSAAGPKATLQSSSRSSAKRCL